MRDEKKEAERDRGLKLYNWFSFHCKWDMHAHIITIIIQ